jgi:hypothetical protein
VPFPKFQVKLTGSPSGSLALTENECDVNIDTPFEGLTDAALMVGERFDGGAVVVVVTGVGVVPGSRFLLQPAADRVATDAARMNTRARARSDMTNPS